MGSNQDLLSALDKRNDGRVVERNDTIDRDLEGFGKRKLLLVDVLVGILVGRVALVVFLEGRRGNVERSSPLMDLFFAVLSSSLSLVESLESAIVTFIQMPVLDERDVVAVNTIENMLGGMDGSLQIGSVADIELEAGLGKKLAAVDGFFDTLFGKLDIRPAGEKIEFVPLTFAMADQN